MWAYCPGGTRERCRGQIGWVLSFLHTESQDRPLGVRFARLQLLPLTIAPACIVLLGSKFFEGRSWSLFICLLVFRQGLVL